MIQYAEVQAVLRGEQRESTEEIMTMLTAILKVSHSFSRLIWISFSCIPVLKFSILCLLFIHDLVRCNANRGYDIPKA